MDQIPALAKPITLEERYTSLSDALQNIYKATGVSLRIAPAVAENLGACILVREMPAWRLLRHLCTLFDLKYEFDGRRIYLDPLDGVEAERTRYLELEDKLLFDRAYRRVHALALATNRPLSQAAPPPEGYPEDEVDRDDKTLAAWAADRVKEASLYAVGVLVRTHPYPATNYRMGEVVSYRLEAPNTSQGAKYNRRSLDNLSVVFRGTQVSLYYEPIAGSFRYAPLDGHPGKPIDVAPPLIRWPKPPSALGGANYAKRLIAWEVDVPENKRKWSAPEGVSQGIPGNPEQGPLSLSDRLLSLHTRTGMPIVADSFRVPSRTRLSADDMSACARLLREQENAFVRCEKDALLVRHGGFWRLRLSEPNGAMIERYENRALGGLLSIPDYVAMVGQMQDGCAARFFEPNRIAVAFDTAPLESAYPALKTLAHLPSNLRAELFSGNPTTLKAAFSDEEQPTTTITGTIPIAKENAAELGPIWGARINRHYAELLEYAPDPAGYLTADDRYSENWAQLPLDDRVAPWLSLITGIGLGEQIGIYYSVSRDVGVIYWVKRKG